MPGLKERAKTMVELAGAADFLYTDGPREADAAAAKVLTADARATLTRILPALEATDWSAAALEAAAREFAETTGLKLGAVAQPLRAAMTGKASSPPLFEVMAVLGPGRIPHTDKGLGGLTQNFATTLRERAGDAVRRTGL